MQEFRLIQDLIVFLAAAFLGGYLAKIFKLPLILGYLIAGVAFGLFFSGKILAREDLLSIGNIGIALLLFTLGLDLSFQKLKKIGKVAILGSSLQIILMAFLGILFLPKLFGFPLSVSLFISLAFSLSSTAVVMKILEDRGEIDTLHGEILTGWLLVQDLAVIPLLLFLPEVLKGQVLQFSLLGSLFLVMVKVFFIITATYLLGKKVFAPFATAVFGELARELFVILTILLVLTSTFLFTKFGLPGAIGAFLAGLLVSDETSHAVFSQVRPFRDLFSAVFFVLLGLLLAPSLLTMQPAEVLGMFLLVTVVKFVLVLGIMLLFGFHTKTSFLTASSLPSVGEFAFVLTGTFVGSTLIAGNIYNLVLSVSLLSLLATPFAIGIAPALYAFAKHLCKRNVRLYNLIFGRRDIDEKTSQNILSSHVIICGHGRVGREISLILQRSNVPFVVIDFNRPALKYLKDRGIPTIYGDPSDFEILDIAGVASAKALLIALPDRHSQELIIKNALKLNPHITIICRSHFDEDRIPLLSIGANSVVQPEFEAGISMARQALTVFNMLNGEIELYITQLKRGQGI